mmetsp:Transcript_40035/g.85763  ORF Transcript_40035/g.85763 Transcript_40035/m.85763 type:complete len:838 (+) Transcript_40035:87-2600(+)
MDSSEVVEAAAEGSEAIPPTDDDGDLEHGVVFDAYSIACEEAGGEGDHLEGLAEADAMEVDEEGDVYFEVQVDEAEGEAEAEVAKEHEDEEDDDQAIAAALAASAMQPQKEDDEEDDDTIMAALAGASEASAPALEDAEADGDEEVAGDEMEADGNSDFGEFHDNEAAYYAAMDSVENEIDAVPPEELGEEQKPVQAETAATIAEATLPGTLSETDGDTDTTFTNVQCVQELQPTKASESATPDAVSEVSILADRGAVLEGEGSQATAEATAEATSETMMTTSLRATVEATPAMEKLSSEVKEAAAEQLAGGVPEGQAGSLAAATREEPPPDLSSGHDGNAAEETNERVAAVNKEVEEADPKPISNVDGAEKSNVDSDVNGNNLVGKDVAAGTTELTTAGTSAIADTSIAPVATATASPATTAVNESKSMEISRHQALETCESVTEPPKDAAAGGQPKAAPKANADYIENEDDDADSLFDEIADPDEVDDTGNAKSTSNHSQSQMLQPSAATAAAAAGDSNVSNLKEVPKVVPDTAEDSDADSLFDEMADPEDAKEEKDPAEEEEEEDAEKQAEAQLAAVLAEEANTVDLEAVPVCARCGATGHNAAKCPFQKSEDIGLGDFDLDDDNEEAEEETEGFVGDEQAGQSSSSTSNRLLKRYKLANGEGVAPPIVQVCWACGDGGHTGEACHRRSCLLCGREGHETDACPNMLETCTHCDLPGHGFSACALAMVSTPPPPAFLPFLRCIRCGTRGHLNCGLPPGVLAAQATAAKAAQAALAASAAPPQKPAVLPPWRRKDPAPARPRDPKPKTVIEIPDFEANVLPPLPLPPPILTPPSP